MFRRAVATGEVISGITTAASIFATAAIGAAASVQAHELAIGDLIMVGPEQTATVIESVDPTYCDETVFDIEVDGDRTRHSV